MQSAQLFPIVNPPLPAAVAMSARRSRILWRLVRPNHRSALYVCTSHTYICTQASSHTIPCHSWTGFYLHWTFSSPARPAPHRDKPGCPSRWYNMGIDLQIGLIWCFRNTTFGKHFRTHSRRRLVAALSFAFYFSWPSSFPTAEHSSGVGGSGKGIHARILRLLQPDTPFTTPDHSPWNVLPIPIVLYSL